jgi:hypothetical protein
MINEHTRRDTITKTSLAGMAAMAYKYGMKCRTNALTFDSDKEYFNI